MTDKQTLKAMVRGGYDIQKLRIEAGNRLVANFRTRLGIDPAKKADDKAIREIGRRFDLITDGVIEFSRNRKFEFDGVISDKTDLSLVAQYMKLHKTEEQIFRDLGHAVKDFDIWNTFLKGVTGCGPAMTSVIISEIDISRARYPSSLWKYAGLDVASDGKGRSKKKEHLIDVEYVNKSGEMATRKSITFNPFLKTKLVGVLGPCFIRAQKEYAEIYYDYKNRIANHPDHVEKSDGHRHSMAIRYMIKIFLIHLHAEWRTLEGLSVSPTYAEAKLNLVHTEH